VLKGNPIHGLNAAVKRKRYHCRNGSEPIHPPKRSGSDVKSEGQNEQSKKEDSHKEELHDMESLITSVAGILREHEGVVIGISIGVKEGHDSEKHFSDDH
jgi:hypothetical protein